MRRQALRIQTAYPQIYFACHTEHRPRGRRTRGLSDRDGRILAHLNALSPIRHRDLAAHLAIQPSTLSEAVDRLAAWGLVVRKRLEKDRRRTLVTLTEEGRDALQTGSVLDTGRVSALLRLLTPEKRRRAIEGIELLADAARELKQKESTLRSQPTRVKK